MSEDLFVVFGAGHAVNRDSFAGVGDGLKWVRNVIDSVKNPLIISGNVSRRMRLRCFGIQN